MNQRDIERERDRILRADGFRDIEAPSGIIQRRQVSATTEANAAREEEYFARAQEFLGRHRFTNELERLVWSAHVQRKGRRVVAREVGVYPKYVDEVVARLKAVMKAAEPKKRRGRPKEDDSLRSEGLRYELRLRPRTQAALDHIRVVLGTRTDEMVRRAIEDIAHRITVRTGKENPT